MKKVNNISLPRKGASLWEEKMYTVRSESPEGVYYLVCNWRKNKTFWVKQEELKSHMLFKTAAGARRSLTCLLKIMPDYSNDIFTLVEVR